MINQLFAFLLVACSTTIEAFGQICFKKKSTKTVGGELGSNMWLFGGVACMIVEAVVWNCVLHQLNVSIAYPMGSLSFVMVLLLSKLILKEKIQRERWIGVVLILCGTILLGLNSTVPNT